MILECKTDQYGLIDYCHNQQISCVGSSYIRNQQSSNAGYTNWLSCYSKDFR